MANKIIQFCMELREWPCRVASHYAQ